MSEAQNSTLNKRRDELAFKYRDRKVQDQNQVTKKEEQIARIQSWCGFLNGWDACRSEMQAEIEKWKAQADHLATFVLGSDHIKKMAELEQKIVDYEEALSKYPPNSHAYNALKKWRKK